jgi:hypothetical protein
MIPGSPGCIGISGISAVAGILLAISDTRPGPAPPAGTRSPDADVFNAARTHADRASAGTLDEPRQRGRESFELKETCPRGTSR